MIAPTGTAVNFLGDENDKDFGVVPKL